MKRINAGIIGTGFSATSHLEALRRLPNVEIVAIFSRNQDKAEQIAEKYGIAKAYSEVEELINDPEVEVVHNCTPNNLHFPLNKKILQAGKHLLSEKPLALNSEQSRELKDLAARKQLVSGVCFNYRHYPMVRQIKEELESDLHGAVHLVYGGYMQDWGLYEDDFSWRMEHEQNGPSRAIADIGSHWCDTVQHILGKNIVKVFADLKTVHPKRKRPTNETSTFDKCGNSDKETVDIDTEDYGSVLVHFEGGVQGVFTVSQVSAGRKNHMSFDIATAESTFSWNQEEPNKIWIGKRNEANRELIRDPDLLSERAASLAHYPGGHQEGWPDGLKNLLIEFYETVRSGDPDSSFATLEDGHRIMQIVDAILESHETEKWIEI